jgi:hypothetical protein
MNQKDLIISLMPRFLVDSFLPGRLEKMLVGDKDDNSYDDMDYILNSD